ncbi:hypothetical protein Tco_0758158 [Tanacetum coccineum]
MLQRPRYGTSTTKEIVHDFEKRFEMIFGRQVKRVHILYFEGLIPDMRQDLAERLRMVYTGDDGQEVIGDEMGLYAAGTLCFQLGGARRSMNWRQFILALGGYFIGHLAHHFGLVSDDGLRGLSVVAHKLPLINIAAEDAPAVDEGPWADPAPVHAPQPPPLPPAAGRTMHQRLGRLEEEMHRRSMGPFEGAPHLSSRDALDRRLARPALP